MKRPLSLIETQVIRLAQARRDATVHHANNQFEADIAVVRSAKGLEPGEKATIVDHEGGLAFETVDPRPHVKAVNATYVHS